LEECRGFGLDHEGELRRAKKLLSIRGLNKDHNHDLKGLVESGRD
jgi:hypothetical protein